MSAARRRTVPTAGVVLGVVSLLVTPGLARGAEWSRVLLLEDYNTRVVLLGATILGVCLGVIGVFMLLRRRSLMGDVVSHASLPGIALAFLILEAASPGAGKNLSGLLLGALVSGVLGMLAVLGLHRFTRLKEDTALAIVLSVFFGAGIVLLSIIQALPSGNAAGLHNFIYGQAASMVGSDARVIAIASLAALVVVVLLFKEMRLLCFDEQFARSQGWPATLLDLLLMTVVVGMSVIGLQSVGLLLVVAMLIIPATAGRFWSDQLLGVVLAAGLIGGAAAYGGVVVSAVTPKAATGAVIVLCGAGLFVLSLLFGTRRGVLRRLRNFYQLQRRVGRLHLLRAAFEVLESRDGQHPLRSAFRPAELQPLRSWSEPQLRKLIHRAAQDGLVEEDADGWRLTERGERAAIQAVRNHRLWEMYLIQFADIAPSHVDRDADDIEHVLGAEVVAQLEQLLKDQAAVEVPESPHEIFPTPSSES